MGMERQVRVQTRDRREISCGRRLGTAPSGAADLFFAARCEFRQGPDQRVSRVVRRSRAMVVRDYLVENFEFDDSQLRTLGMGKQKEENSEAGWGTVQIFIYPAETEIPPDKVTPAAVSSKSPSDQPVQASAAATPRP